MTKVKVVILVLSFHDSGNTYDEFQKSQKETWDSIEIEGVKTFYIYGNSDVNKISDDEIYVNVTEDLWRCNLKTIESLEILNTKFDYDYLFRTNSSSYVDKKLLIDFLSDKPTEKYYAGHSSTDQDVNYVSGSGIIMSKDLVQIILNEKNKIDLSLMDDASFAKILNSNGVFPIQVDRCNYSDIIVEKLDCNSFLYRLKSSSTRRTDIENMYRIHELKNK
jgi:hypothetical protein